MSQTSFGKRDRDRAKKLKAAEKRDRRQAGGATDTAGDAPASGTTGGPALSTADILERIGEIHRRHESGEISDDEFEETKTLLLGQLVIE